MLLQQQIPTPDSFFWYTVTIILGAALVGLVVWIVNRYLSNQEKWQKKVDERYIAINKELTDSKRVLALHSQTLEFHSKSLELKDNEVQKSFAVTEQMIATLKYLRGES